MEAFDVSRNSSAATYDQHPTKPPKRKRLAKACDACHKSKRRCDGTSPCSNCFYASKPCSYTDSAGRAVPPPRITDPDQDSERPAKRLRSQDAIRTGIPIPLERPPPLDLDPGMTRELTNLFFTHSHPALAIIHKPTFTSSLAHNLIPPYLLHAVCCLSAPHSKQPSLRTIPSRLAGRRFADEAKALMFDANGRLALQSSLQVAQAMCLLTIYEGIAQDETLPDPSQRPPWATYRELTLQLLQSLNVHTPEHPLLTPVPSQSYVHDSIERECIRRIFWVIYLLDCFRGVYFRGESSRNTRSYLRASQLRQSLPLAESDDGSRTHPASERWANTRRNSGHWGKTNSPTSAAPAALVQSSPAHGSWPPHPEHAATHPQSLQPPTPSTPWGAKVNGGGNEHFHRQQHAGSSPPFVHRTSSHGHLPTIVNGHQPPGGYTPAHMSWSKDAGGSAMSGGVMGFSQAELRLRLPADETSFELGAVHESLPEYLYLPAVRTQYASELGHMIRVMTIYQKVELALDNLFAEHSVPSDDERDGRPSSSSSNSDPGSPAFGSNQSGNSLKHAATLTLMECERLLEEWASSLPSHLRFSVQSLSVQQSMLETSSNTGAWCYAALHIYHASCSLGLGFAKLHLHRSNGSDESTSVKSFQWAVDMLNMIMTMLGDRAKSSLILGTVLWPLIKYCNRGQDPQVQTWVTEYEEHCGINMYKTARNRWGANAENLLLNFGRADLQAAPEARSQSRSSSDWSPVPGSANATPSSVTNGSDGSDKGQSPHLDEHHGAKPPNPHRKSSSASSSEHILPSLKSSGLLEWNQANGQPQPPQAGTDPMRTVPVGLSWLANESR